MAPPGAGRLDRCLVALLPELSRARIQALIKRGAVTVDDQTSRPAHKLRGGERLQVRLPPPRPCLLQPENIPLDILYQDRDVVVIDKPAGMVVHPAPGHRSGTLVHALLHALPQLADAAGQERPGIVHRLDKGTSGVLVVALHDVALRRLQARFALHEVQREYLAVVCGVPEFLEGAIRSQLGRHPRDRVRFASVERGGRQAVTHWRRLATGQGVSLLSCRLETGRTHQIRVHLCEQDLPVVGDPLYRGRRQLPAALSHWRQRLDHQLLHAARLGFEQPVDGRPLRFHAPPPEDFQAFCREAGLPLPGC